MQETSPGDAVPPDATKDADAAAHACSGTWDCTQSIANQICSKATNCTVCVQTVDQNGNAIAWAALYDCTPCPTPSVSTVVDAGADAAAGPDAPNAPDAADATSPPDASCVGTFDIGTESMAEQICNHQSNCKVCVQEVDNGGNATAWTALVDCPCPPPRTKVDLDASHD